jgi:hypothetical protein
MRSKVPTAQRQGESFSVAQVVGGVSILIVLAVLATVYAGFVQRYRTVASFREEQRAIEILLTKTEALRSYTWNQLHDRNFMPETFTAGFDQQSPTGSGPLYTGRIEVAALPSSTESYRSNLCQVRLSVSWASRGATHQREVTTLIANRGSYTSGNAPRSL